MTEEEFKKVRQQARYAEIVSSICLGMLIAQMLSPFVKATAVLMLRYLST